jgi:hypothetical protein
MHEVLCPHPRPRRPALLGARPPEAAVEVVEAAGVQEPVPVGGAAGAAVDAEEAAEARRPMPGGVLCRAQKPRHRAAWRFTESTG